MQDKPPAQALLNPVHTGYLSKHGFAYGCWPSWKQRYCIVTGGFLFKYVNPHGREPKGTPLALTDCDIDEVDLPTSAKTPDGAQLMGIRCRSLTRETLFGAPSAESRATWIRVLRAHKQLVIKQLMGHAPMSPDEEFAAKSGKVLNEKSMERQAIEMDRPDPFGMAAGM